MCDGVYYVVSGLFLMFFWCPCMAINVNVQYNVGLLPDIILLTQCYLSPAGLSSDLYPPRSIEGKTRTKLCQKRPQVTGLRSSPELRPV